MFFFFKHSNIKITLEQINCLQSTYYLEIIPEVHFVRRANEFLFGKN